MPINDNGSPRFPITTRRNRRPPLLASALTLLLCLTLTGIIGYVKQLPLEGWPLALYSGSLVFLPVAIFAFLLNLDRRKSHMSSQHESWIHWLNRNPSRVCTLINLERDILYVSESCQSILGYAPELLLRHRLMDFIYPFDQRGVQNALEHAINTGYETRVAYRFLKGNNGNGWLWVESLIEPVSMETLEGDLLITSRDYSESWFWNESEKIRLKALRLQESQASLVDILRAILEELQTLFPEFVPLVRLKTTDTHGEIKQFASRPADDAAHSGSEPAYHRRLDVERPGYYAELLLIRLPSAEIGYLDSRLLDSATETLRSAVEWHRVNSVLELGSSVFTQSNDAIAVVEKACIYAANPSFSFLTGYREDEFIGIDDFFSFLSEDKEMGTQAFYDNVLKARHWHGEGTITRRNGTQLTVDWTISVMADPGGHGEPKFLNILRDVTEARKSAQLIWQNANYDALTGLPNRYHFQSYLTKALQDASRENHGRLVLLFIDLDHFKEVNDTLGHETGDKLLVLVAERIRSAIRASDFTARLGGDEFTALLKLTGTDNGQAERVAEKINDALRRPFSIGIEQINVSASIGLTIYPDDGQTVETLLKNADQAMYHAKALGRDRFAWFSPEMQDHADFRRNVINALRNSVLAGKMVVHYQPIVDLATSRVVRLEALVRWPEAIYNMDSPSDFIEFAEYAGLMGRLGAIVQQAVVRQTHAWKTRNHLDLQTCINLSPRECQDPESVTTLLGLLKQQGLPGNSLVVEITEDCFLDAASAIQERLQQLQDAGIRLAIDDFGQGSSSLSHLNQFHFDFLKIDRSFISDIGPDGKNTVVVEAMIAMAHKLGIKVVAVGVENEAQHQLLLVMGCDLAQGYYYAKPMNAADTTRYLLEGKLPENVTSGRPMQPPARIAAT
jgi:diguanylate cyclase (GGDEF)-like protein/PAS domain S-box-containing protein